MASYTVPKVDVLVSATFRSLRTTIPFLASNNSATNGASLAANYNVPNTVVQSLLGRLPSGTNANGTTTVNLVEPAQVYGERVTQIDMAAHVPASPGVEAGAKPMIIALQLGWWIVVGGNHELPSRSRAPI